MAKNDEKVDSLNKYNRNEDDDLVKMKELYERLKSRYSGLPSFDKLNEEFDIGKVDFNEVTLARDVRKAMINKFFAILNFVEMLLNPSNGTMFQMFLVKGINSVEKDILNKLFEELGIIEIESFYLDINYNEDKEVEFIVKNFQEWPEMKKELNKVIESLRNNWRKTSSSKGKSYFG